MYNRFQIRHSYPDQPHMQHPSLLYLLPYQYQRIPFSIQNTIILLIESLCLQTRVLIWNSTDPDDQRQHWEAFCVAINKQVNLPERTRHNVPQSRSFWLGIHSVESPDVNMEESLRISELITLQRFITTSFGAEDSDDHSRQSPCPVANTFYRRHLCFLNPPSSPPSS